MADKKTQKRKKIALVLNVLDEAYQISLYSGIIERAKELGLDLICLQNEDMQIHENSLVATFPTKSFFNVDGIILLTSVFSEDPEIQNKSSLEKIWHKIPIISVGQKIDGLTSLAIRTKKAMEDLTKHLIAVHKYKRILYISGIEEHPDSKERQEVFTEVMDRYMKKDPLLNYSILRGNFNEVTARETIAEYIEKNPDNPADVIVCANDNMALGVSKYLTTQENSNWKKCAVTGFDDIPQAVLELPAFTTVHQPLKEMGIRAVELMVEKLNKNKIDDMSYVDSSLVVRQSCGCKSKKKDEKILTMERINRLQNNYFQSEQLLRSMNHIVQQLNSCGETDGLKYTLDSNMEILGVDDFAVYAFKNPIHHYNDFVQGTNIICEELFVRWHGKQLTKKGKIKTGKLTTFFAKILYENTNSIVVKLMTTSNGIIGCIVYNAPSFLHPYICSISTNLAQTIFKLHTLEEQQIYSERLEAEVSKRTEQLVEANNRRIQVEAEVLKISEMERQRFSRDLHDDICQRLAGIAMLCRSYSNQTKKITKEQMLEISELTSETLQITRQYAHNSYPVELDALGLKDSIGNLCASFQTATGISCNYEWALSDDKPFSKLESINLFRIIQEAIQNIGKHANANSVIVKIQKEKNEIICQIIDDGKGMPASSNGKLGLGMKSMIYRADQIDATFKVKSNAPKGTVIEIRKVVS